MSARIRSPMRRALVLAGAAGLSFAAAAHEFWIAPRDYAPAPGEPIVASLLVGEGLEGETFPYRPQRFHAFTVTSQAGTRPVGGEAGDDPALTWQPDGPGLHVVAYQSLADLAHHDSWAAFTRYLDAEGLDGVAAAHAARGLPASRFNESYTRYAKALVQVGPARPGDADRALGLAFELVLDADGAGPRGATLLWRGAPAAGVQITVYRRRASVQRAVVRTGADGRAVLPLSGHGEFLLSAVHVEPVEGASVVWHSHWASLTFRSAGP